MSYFDYTLNSENQIVNFRGEIIEKPAILFDRVTGTLHAHGEEVNVNAHYDRFKERDKTGIIVNDLTRFGWNMEQANSAEVVEELNKLINNTGYAVLFYKRQIDCSS